MDKVALPANASGVGIMERYRGRIFLLYVVAAAAAFGVLFLLARNVPYFSFDVPAARAIQSIGVPGFGTVMLWLTALGADPLSWIWCGAIVIGLFVVGLRWEAVMAVFAAAGVSAAGYLLKELVQRARPTSDLFTVVSEVSGYSFPSGHVLFFTAFLGFLMFLLYTLVPPSGWRTLGMVLLALPIALIGVSRVYLGQHFPSDAIGAYLFASLWLALTIWIYRLGKKRWATL